MRNDCFWYSDVLFRDLNWRSTEVASGIRQIHLFIRQSVSVVVFMLHLRAIWTLWWNTWVSRLLTPQMGLQKRCSFLCMLSRGIILNASSVWGKKQKEKELQIIKLNTWLKSSVSLLSSVESKKLVLPLRTNILKQGDRSNNWRSPEIKVFCGVEMLY